MRRSAFISAVVAGLITFLMRPKKVLAPTHGVERNVYPHSKVPISPGDLLFSPIGKSESKYVGHVGIVTFQQEVVHSIPSGLVNDPIPHYFEKFRSISVYSAKNSEAGAKAAEYVESILEEQRNSRYRVFTPLQVINQEQYCTKIVWQAYYYGSGINLGRLPKASRAIHPQLLKDRRHLNRLI
ncbi:YiiX/YebB-like N1pC/P60 family cysteine hydrolase [Halobacillus sp. Marseille-Q1614]|uniref:YiiX/YebB-like N1pC/P60 family cysteine hydrolase n=1 Tax=Halobacillus sp. Marseille-Q1614 TaxID=2709134 RepID=UPI00156DAC64|nr:YiiX/YebB-like N1pC/P60 family cysteine hydrolase [Halobacillus sp. Marseille-Q1614]